MNESRLVKELIPLAGLAMLAGYGINKSNEAFLKPVTDCIDKKLEGFNRSKMVRRVDRELKPLFAMLKDKSNMVNAHKVILTLHSLAEMMIEKSMIKDDRVVECFEPFLELESQREFDNNGRKIEDSDWTKLKNSADKIAKKYLMACL